MDSGHSSKNKPAVPQTPQQAELGDEPLDPAEMLALLEHQQRAFTQAHVLSVALLYGVWGIAWLIGFVLLWLGWSAEWMPLALAGAIFAALIVTAIVISAIVGIRIGRGVRGASDFAGAVYGLSWSVLGIALAAIGMGLLQHGLSQELASLYFPSAYAVMAGIMYLFGAALWNEKSQLVVGVPLLALGALAPFAGAPHNNLVMALGGVVFLAASIRDALRARKR
ncbi:hypothetical protein [Ruicaihuangia caeni]|uniref:DUF2157 domain-containing protein n=1 Tax=Ruicaihuangia caeni TaxID=3042517 RepID=A0AAW6TAU4_9MICO|nr:hypothetical protein [Klugiella sp. YN-L-19]MDI2099559.1 hypothetical protein [Klugiella sp. YN-L-19]